MPSRSIPSTRYEQLGGVRQQFPCLGADLGVPRRGMVGFCSSEAVPRPLGWNGSKELAEIGLNDSAPRGDCVIPRSRFAPSTQRSTPRPDGVFGRSSTLRTLTPSVDFYLPKSRSFP